jgi:hypothetical protein
MSIKRTIIAAIVGLTLVALVAPGVAQGVTIDELLAQIAQLQAQLIALQSGGSTTTAGTGACAGITFTRNMTVGATGSDVKCLQVLLNNNGFTVATTGAGSPGAETTYFGSRTLAAVKVFQAAKGFTPANQVGPLTRGALNALLGTTTGGTTPPVVTPTGSGLQVMTAYDTPASGTLVSGATSLANAQGGADIAHFTFVNGDNAPVKVTGLSFNRTGVSQDTLLQGVYLYEGANRLTDSASVSSGVVNFNLSSGLFTVPAGGSVTVRVLVDLYYGMSGQTVGLSLASASAVTTNASSVKGTFPIQSNLQTTAAATLATVSFTASSGTTPTGGDVDPANDYTVWQNIVSVSTRAVKLNRFALYQTGSALSTDIQNYRLYVDGVQVGSAVAGPDSNGYVTFDLSANPLTIQTGSRTIKVLADIIGGSSKTFTYSLRSSPDASFTDTQIGVGIQPQVASSTFSQVRSCYLTATSFACTINSGSVTFSKTTDSPSGNIVLGAPNAVLARYTLTAAGEPVKITDLYVGVVDSTTAGVTYFRNGALYANGAQIGSTTDIAEGDITTGTHFSLGSSLIVTPGTPTTLEIRADVKETSGTTAVANADSVYATIIAGSSNAEGRVSKSTISTPSANTNGNTLTVKTGALTLSKYLAYTSQTAVAPVTKYKLAHFTLTNDTVEAINISAIEADLNGVSSYATNLYVTYGTQTTTTKPTVSAANSWSVNYQLPANTTIDVMVFADVSSSMTSGTGQASVEVCGTTASSAVAVYTNSGTACTGFELAGQSITFSSGAFTQAFASTPQNQIVAGNQAVEVGRFKFTSSYQQYTLTELRFSAASDAIAGVISSATLKDGSTALATVPYDSALDYFDFYLNTLANGGVIVPASTSKTLTLVYNLSIPSSTAGTSNVDVKPTLTYVKKQDPNGTVTNSGALTVAANSTIVYRSIPVLSQVDLTNSAIANGAEIDLYKFKVTAPSQGDVNIKQFKLAVTWTDGGTPDTQEVSDIKLLADGVNINDSVTIQNEDGYTVEGATHSVSNTGTTGDDTIVFTWNTTTEYTISAGTTTTYTVRGTPSGFGIVGTTFNETGTDSVALALNVDSAAQTAGYNSLDTGDATTTIIKLYSTSGDASSSAENAKFLWSDESAVAHSASTTASTADWTNGYLVQDQLSSETWTH